MNECTRTETRTTCSNKLHVIYEAWGGKVQCDNISKHPNYPNFHISISNNLHCFIYLNKQTMWHIFINIYQDSDWSNSKCSVEVIIWNSVYWEFGVSRCTRTIAGRIARGLQRVGDSRCYIHTPPHTNPTTLRACLLWYCRVKLYLSICLSLFNSSRVVWWLFVDLAAA